MTVAVILLTGHAGEHALCRRQARTPPHESWESHGCRQPQPPKPDKTRGVQVTLTCSINLSGLAFIARSPVLQLVAV